MCWRGFAEGNHSTLASLRPSGSCLNYLPLYFFILVSCSCNFDNLSPSRLLLNSGGIRFPPKERGFFLTSSRHVSLSCSCYTHTSCIMSDFTIKKLGLLLAGSRAISVWSPNLVQQPVSYLLVKSCCLLSD